MTWDPAQYARFADERARPALDLAARIPPIEPRLVVDLGCGRGDMAAQLAERWPDAAVVGIDRSPEMLADAQARFSGPTWVEADIATWQPETAPDLIYSNATLHWLPDHATLFPRLMTALAPGGVLAVQMPRNFAEPSHVLLRAVAAEGPWHDRVSIEPAPVAAQQDYHAWLRPQAAAIDLWETIYLHVLEGADPVLNWVRGTALRPVLSVLDPAEQTAFEADYGARLRAAYPANDRGETLMPFRRLFLVAQKDG